MKEALELAVVVKVYWVEAEVRIMTILALASEEPVKVGS